MPTPPTPGIRYLSFTFGAPLSEIILKKTMRAHFAFPYIAASCYGVRLPVLLGLTGVRLAAGGGGGRGGRGSGRGGDQAVVVAVVLLRVCPPPPPPHHPPPPRFPF